MIQQRNQDQHLIDRCGTDDLLHEAGTGIKEMKRILESLEEIQKVNSFKIR